MALTPTFVQLYQKGLVNADEIDDYIDCWHTQSPRTSHDLAEFLGLTPSQYSRWLKTPEQLDEILQS